MHYSLTNFAFRIENLFPKPHYFEYETLFMFLILDQLLLFIPFLSGIKVMNGTRKFSNTTQQITSDRFYRQGIVLSNFPYLDDSIGSPIRIKTNFRWYLGWNPCDLILDLHMVHWYKKKTMKTIHKRSE